jgi:hypothetical protein
MRSEREEPKVTKKPTNISGLIDLSPAKINAGADTEDASPNKRSMGAIILSPKGEDQQMDFQMNT